MKTDELPFEFACVVSLDSVLAVCETSRWSISIFFIVVSFKNTIPKRTKFSYLLFVRALRSLISFNSVFFSVLARLPFLFWQSKSAYLIFKEGPQ